MEHSAAIKTRIWEFDGPSRPGPPLSRPRQWECEDRELSGQRLDKASPAPPRRKALLELVMNWELQAHLWKLIMQQPSCPRNFRRFLVSRKMFPKPADTPGPKLPNCMSSAGSAHSVSHHGDMAGRFHTPGCEREDQAPVGLYLEWGEHRGA